MKKSLVFAVATMLLTSIQASAQSVDPFAPAPSNADRDPFAEPTKAQPRYGTPKKRSSPATIAKASPVASTYQYLAVGADSASRTRIEQALSSEASFDYLDQPLREVIDDIAFSHNIPIIIDVRSLEEYGFGTDTPITRSLKGIRLRSALKLMLDELDLTYMIRDEVLQITTMETAESKLSTRFYPVSELLPEAKDGTILVDLITTMVLPDSWSTVGGPASIVYIEHLEALAISQTDEAFYEIGNLLSATKKLADMTKKEGPTKVMSAPAKIRVTPVPGSSNR